MTRNLFSSWKRNLFNRLVKHHPSSDRQNQQPPGHRRRRGSRPHPRQPRESRTRRRCRRR